MKRNEMRKERIKVDDDERLSMDLELMRLFSSVSFRRRDVERRSFMRLNNKLGPNL